MDPPGGFEVGRRSLEMEIDVDPADDQDAVLQLDFTDGFGDQPAPRSVDLARLQRASEGPRESTRRGGDDVVEGRRVGTEDLRRDLVMGRDGAVHPEDHRLVLGGKVCLAQGALHPLDPDLRAVNHFGHVALPDSAHAAARIISPGRGPLPGRLPA